MKKIKVAVLGATGTVGQKFIRLLENHPLFSVSELVASERSAGKSYAEAVAWKQETLIPAEIAQMTVKPLSAGLASPLLLSGLDSSIAGDAETDYAAAGHTVISNSSNHRMDSDVPIIIPEINPDHFELVKHQQGPGAIVTNSNKLRAYTPARFFRASNNDAGDLRGRVPWCREHGHTGQRHSLHPERGREDGGGGGEDPGQAE